MSIELCFKRAGVAGSRWDRFTEDAIAWWTRGDLPPGCPYHFCHVELQLYVVAGASLCFSSTLETGTRLAWLDARDPALWVRVPIAASPGETINARAWARVHCGLRYNDAAIAGFVTARLPIPIYLNHKHAMFCSQSVADCCRDNLVEAYDWPDAKLPGSRISPNKLYALATGS